MEQTFLNYQGKTYRIKSRRGFSENDIKYFPNNIVINTFRGKAVLTYYRYMSIGIVFPLISNIGIGKTIEVSKAQILEVTDGFSSLTLVEYKIS